MRNRYKRIPLVLVFSTIPSLLFSAAVLAEKAPQSSERGYLYKTTFVRAAPGKLLDLIALYKSRMEAFNASGDERPLWWRHTQGDQWDLMFLFPMGSYTEYYSKERVSRRKKAGGAASLSDQDFLQRLHVCSAWREDIFVLGPPLEEVKKAFADTAYYHIEIFISLPGKQEELYKEREMENIYQVATGRPENLIFVRDQGAAWDLFTLGCYRDLKHWASSSDIPKEKRDSAARQAGFNNPDEIGPYMRTLIDMHRDTMGVAIK
ncbi:MAG: hypothetical protein OEW18_01790 [Candidatus Aminicenantes bacterium]|nr:hypothetical protein [Candidatus Aminicenantes bacterium]